MSLPTLINLTLLAAFLYTAYRSIRRALRHRQSTTEPTCAHCGYTVLHLPTPTCPECGKDLQSVGVIPPGRTSYRIAVATVVTIALCLTAAMTSSLLRKIPQYLSYQASCLTYPGPWNIANPEIQLSASGSGPFRKIHPDAVSVFACGPATRPAPTSAPPPEWIGPRPLSGRQGTIRFLPASNEWVLTSPSKSTRLASPPDTAAIDHWLSDLGLPPDPSRADELARAIAALKNTPDLSHLDLPTAAPFTHWQRISWTNGTWPRTPPFLALLLTANRWLFAFLWALAIGPLLIRRPKPLRGSPATHLLQLTPPATADH